MLVKITALSIFWFVLVLFTYFLCSILSGGWMTLDVQELSTFSKVVLVVWFAAMAKLSLILWEYCFE